MLEYLYLNKVILDLELAIELTKVANKYSLAGLQDVCNRYIITQFTVCNRYIITQFTVCNIIEIANMAEVHDLDMLKDAAIKFILQHQGDVAENDDLSELSKTLLVEIFLQKV